MNMDALTIEPIIIKNIGQISHSLTRWLTASGTPYLDAQVLLAHITGKPRGWILAHPDYKLPPHQQINLSEAISQLKDGVPLPYILGHWEFYNLDFEITPEVLIPRPETELLVETAIQWLLSHPQCRRVADIGTGSGCIAISIATNIPNSRVTAVDISEAALEVAQKNAAKYALADQIRFIHANLLNLPPSTFDLICANLPYIPTGTLHQLDIFGREPTLALDGGMDGLYLIRDLIQDIPQYLAPGGLVLIEIEANQGNSALKFTQAHLQNTEISLHADLSGHDRLIRIQT
jgi:release factor glutamine methyltransferase